jgi:simple sugar transport system ATP-binding protein
VIEASDGTEAEMATDTATTRPEEAVPLLRMSGITKRFPGVLANDAVDFEVQAGEVHALFGENGAGKSTLMRILYGLYRPDEGEIQINGAPVVISSPAAAIRNGIGMIHQHFMLVNTLTVVENVALGLKSSRGPLTDLGKVKARLMELAERHGLEVPPEALVWQLSVGERQRVEILKALYRDVSLLVLDEPTAVLTPHEVDDLFRVLRQLASSGRGLVFISHKVNEVLDLSDQITVLRAGKRVGTLSRQDASHSRLIQMMVGHELSSDIRPAAAPAGEKRLVVRGLCVTGDRGQDAVRDVDLEVDAGEIVGIAGVSGNGQRELAEAIAGIRAPKSGSVTLDGTETAGSPPARVRGAGLAYVPEERMRDGIVPDFTVAENLMLVDNSNPPYSRFGFLRSRTIRRHCQELVDAFNVKTPSLDTPARNLSGGNIQKLIMARELSGEPRLLLVAQPTRGIDIGAAQYIHHRLVEQRDAGTAVLIISEDLDEVMSISDRILVMYEGRIIGTADPRTSTREAIGFMMAGVSADAVDAPEPATTRG